jgi:inhibitor of KinA
VDRARIEPFGDSALLITFGNQIDAAVTRRVRDATHALEQLRTSHPDIGAPVAAYAAVLLPFNPLVVGPDEAVGLTIDALERAVVADPVRETPIIEIPTRYSGVDGPDLREVADAHGITVPQAIECHTNALYVVAFIGFMPGFPYMIGGPPELDHPRRATPRTRVPAGSVAIAGLQGTVYPFATPGGWNLIGRTDHHMWDTRRNPPALLAPGSRVRFTPAEG